MSNAHLAGFIRINRIGAVRVAAAVLLTTGAHLPAQDVTITPPSWENCYDVPDQPPALKNKLSLAFPSDLKATPDIGYVVFDVVLDKKGQTLANRPLATLAAYERAAHVIGGSFTRLPGRRAGEGVNTEFSFAVVFNPASASSEQSDATPRLLEVALVKRTLPKEARRGEALPDRIEWIDVIVDATGRIAALKNAPADVARICEIAAKNWRFGAARRGGTAIAAEMRVPFIIVSSFEPEPDSGKRVQPRVLRQQRPVYPLAMRASEMRGEVLVDFIVDIEGRVRNPFVVRTLNPAFDDPTITAIREWRFEPGRVGDRPVKTHMQVPVLFGLNELPGGGSGPFRKKAKGDLAKLAESYRYDTPPKPRGTVRVVYPYGLLRGEKSGKATVQFVVGIDGKVSQVEVTEAAMLEFGCALKAAVEGFVFEPAIKAGRPGLSLESFTQEFGRFEGMQTLSREELFMVRREERKPESIISSSELDDPPVELSRPPPRFPQSVAANVKKGRVVVEFLIDEEGTARLPRVISATEDAFGYAAVQNVASWRFAPPTCGGRPVAVRVQMPVLFGEEDNTKKADSQK